MEEGDAGADAEGGHGEGSGELAEVIYLEWMREAGCGGVLFVFSGWRGRGGWQADFLVGFAAGGEERGFVEVVGLAAGEGGVACDFDA